jgi:glycosyltransferase involved in cell wall biosynthesis
MRIAFLDCGPLVYDFGTPLVEPLGGSESGICYLGAALLGRGHEVVITKSVQECLGWDVVVVNTNVGDCLKLRGAGFGDRVVLWNGQDVDQLVCRGLGNELHVGSFDVMVLGSAWHKVQFDMHFPLTRLKSRVMRLGAGTPFCSQSGLVKEPVLAYLSTPYRGLDVLADVWPIVHKRLPELSLEVYSGMNLYRRADVGFEGLYERLRGLEGVTLSAAVSQSELASRLARVVCFAYPATFRETFCVSLVDAMCCGCFPVLSDVGALRESCVGFGRLVPFGDRFVERYADVLTVICSQLLGGGLLRECEYMVGACRSFFDWGLIALEWEESILRG